MAVRRNASSQAGLKDHAAALDVAVGETPNLCMIFGECEYLRSEAVAAVRDAWLERHQGGDMVVLRGVGDARPATLSSIMQELAGGSLFSRDKLVLVRQAEKVFFSRGGDGEDVASISTASEREKGVLAYLETPSPSLWLLMESAQLPKNRTLGKRLDACCHIVPCPQPTPREIPDWMLDKAGEFGKTLDVEAIDLLSRAHGSDLGALAREIEKLALFAGEAPRIDAHMVGEFLTGTMELDVFGLTNAVEARDRRKALFYARRIAVQGTRDQKGKKEDGERSSHRIFALLANTVQNLLRARVAVAERMPSAEFASAEKLSPWRADRLLAASRKFELRELRTMVGFVADQLRRVHDTGGDPLLTLELMAVKLTSGEEGAR